MFRNFDSETFLHTIHTVSWYEVCMIGALALSTFCAFRKTRSSETLEGKSLLASGLLACAATIGFLWKIRLFLDVAVFMYLAFLVFAVADVVVLYRKTIQLEEIVKTKQLRERRRVLLERSGGDPSRRRSHSSRSRRTVSSSSHRRRRYEGYDVCANKNEAVKEPLFDDPLADD